MAQRFHIILQEKLNKGTKRVWIQAPIVGKIRATQIGLHSFARGTRGYTATWTPGAIASQTMTMTAVTVTDATAGDIVKASFDGIGSSDLMLFGWVPSADTVNVLLFNPTSSSVTPSSGTLTVLVFPVIGTSIDGPPV